MSKIVVWDPSGRFPEGEIVKDDNTLHLLHSSGGVSLPVVEDLLQYNAIAGFFMRKWGNGVRFERMVGTLGCPMILWIKPQFTSIYWAARIKPIPEAKETKGIFRLAMHSGQYGVIGAGIASNDEAIEIGELELDEYGGAIIQGSCRLSSAIEGYLGVSLYGVAVGARIMWSAITQAQ
jgi:hypothetical protein